MKIAGLLIFIFLFSARVDAAQFSLIKIDTSTYESHIQTIKKEIARDDAEPTRNTFYRDQSFLLKDDKGQRIGYFIPVNFTSKSYGKQICRLFYFDLDNNFKYSELFADAGSSDEVVPNCVAIEAISIQTVGVDEVNYLAVLRHLFFSNYGHVGVVVNFKKGNIHYDSELNKCIDAQGESPNINSLKKKILFCQRSHKSNN